MINPFKSKKGLGRGLSSLIGDSEVKALNNKISISSIIPNKFQPRKKFDKESLEELANSIRERGVIQPLIVRRSADDNSKYELIAGERRWQAAQKAGLHEVPIVEVEADNLKSLEFAIVENVQRSDLNTIEDISKIIIGNGTTSRKTIKKLDFFKKEIITFEEKNTTYRAKERYFELFPISGLMFLIPREVFILNKNLDAISASIILEDYCKIKFNLSQKIDLKTWLK